MKIRNINGITQYAEEVKTIGDIIVIEGVDHVIESVNIYHETYDDRDEYRFDYTLTAEKAEVLPEPTMEELQEL